ncbi:IS5 family transposase [Xanthomonas oryzae pv. oryzae]|nr:IS5 family transposase [Xanthomonas oryzae pv. oryzae]
MALDQTTASGRAGDRTSETGLPLESLPSQRRPRRCTARARLRRWLQPALAAALDRLFACLVAGGAGAFLNALKHHVARKYGTGGLRGVFQGRLFTGEVVFQTCVPCDPSSLTRWRQRLGEAGMEELLAHTINTAHMMKAVDARELSRVIVDTTVQEKAIAHPTDSRLLEVARKKLVLLAKRHGITLRQSYARQGPALRRKAGRHAHARQFKRMRKELRRQRTLLGRVLRDLQRKLAQQEPSVRERIGVWLERAQRLLAQRPKDKQKLYALHAPEVECMSKGKASSPYEFGVKVGIAVSARKGLIVGARSFPGNPYDGDTLAEQLEQARGLLQDVDVIPQVAIVDLGYRGRDVEGVQILHRGQAKTLTRRQWRWIKRRQAVEPVIGHLKQDCRLNRCHLKGAQGDALHVLGCAAGYNLRWLLRWIAFLRALLQVVRARSSTPSSTMWPANMALEV